MYACIHMPFISPLGWHPCVLPGLFLCDMSGTTFPGDRPLALRPLLWVNWLLGSCPYLPWVDLEHDMMKENNRLLFVNPVLWNIEWRDPPSLPLAVREAKMLTKEKAACRCFMHSGKGWFLSGHWAHASVCQSQTWFNWVLEVSYGCSSYRWISPSTQCFRETKLRTVTYCFFTSTDRATPEFDYLTQHLYPTAESIRVVQNTLTHRQRWQMIW